MDIRKPQNVHSNQPNKVVQRNKLLNANPAIVVDRLKASHWRFENVIFLKSNKALLA